MGSPGLSPIGGLSARPPLATFRELASPVFDLQMKVAKGGLAESPPMGESPGEPMTLPAGWSSRTVDYSLELQPAGSVMGSPGLSPIGGLSARPPLATFRELAPPQFRRLSALTDYINGSIWFQGQFEQAVQVLRSGLPDSNLQFYHRFKGNVTLRDTIVTSVSCYTLFQPRSSFTRRGWRNKSRQCRTLRWTLCPLIYTNWFEDNMAPGKNSMSKLSACMCGKSRDMT
jgi:hypothetical protein